jgi:hypothetical protein
MDQPGFQYGLHSVKKLTSYLNSIDSIGIKSLEEEKIVVNKSYWISFNYEEGIISIKFSADFLSRTETPEPLKLFGAVVNCDFKLVGFQEILKKDEKGQVDLPDDLLITLLSVCYSTSRGMLAVQTAGTDYSNVFLPLVGTSEFGLVLKNVAENSTAKQES